MVENSKLPTGFPWVHTKASNLVAQKYKLILIFVAAKLNYEGKLIFLKRLSKYTVKANRLFFGLPTLLIIRTFPREQYKAGAIYL